MVVSRIAPAATEREEEAQQASFQTTRVQPGRNVYAGRGRGPPALIIVLIVTIL